VSVQAEVQTPVVCLTSCELSIDDAYLGTPVIRQAALFNETLLATTFQWCNVSSQDCAIPYPKYILYEMKLFTRCVSMDKIIKNHSILLF